MYMIDNLRHYPIFKTYGSELENMKILFDHSDQRKRRKLAFKLFNKVGNVNEKTILDAREQKSQSAYRSGEYLWKKDPEQTINACRLLTHAIRVAPENSEYLKLSYEERSKILVKMQLWVEACTDYERSILLDKNASPEIKNQILNAQTSNPEFYYLRRLQLFEKLTGGPKKFALISSFKRIIAPVLPKYNISNIVVTVRDSAPRVFANCEIQEGQEIFKEPIFAFFPFSEYYNFICHNCAATQFIPHFCSTCAGNISYCSYECQIAHKHIHDYECHAFQIKLFEEFDVLVPLAMRIILAGLPTIVPLLANKSTAEEMWDFIFNELIHSQDIEYVNVLNMSVDSKDILNNLMLRDSMASELIVMYLRRLTRFFDIFKKTNASIDEWELLVASLLLLHLHQLPVNARCINAVFQTSFIMTPNSRSFQNSRIQPGHLHIFNNPKQVAVGLFPRLAFCTQQCQRNFFIEQVGCNLSIRAARNIEKGEQIQECVDLIRTSMWPRYKRDQFFNKYDPNASDCKSCKARKVSHVI